MKNPCSPKPAEPTLVGKVCPECSALYGRNCFVHPTDLLPVAAEVTMFDEVVVCYKFIGDLMFYVTGSQDENELILHTVLVAFYESVTLLLRCEAVSNFTFT